MKRSVHRMPQVMPAQPIRVEKKSHTRRYALGLIALGVIGVIYWFFFYSRTFAIQTIEINGVDPMRINSVADRLKGENIFRLNTATLEQSLKQAYPPIASVSVVRGIPQSVRFDVSLRKPALRWIVNDVTYIVDEGGRVFEQGDKPDYAALPKIVDKTNTGITLGQSLVAESFVQFVQDLTTKATEKLQKPYLGNEIVETTFHLDVLFEGDIRIRLTTQRPLEEQLTGAARILQLHPEARLVDVRIPQRGYWK